MKNTIRIVRGARFEWTAEGPVPGPGTPEFEAAAEAHEERLDANFRDQFSPSAMTSLAKETRQLLRKQGWRDTGKSFKKGEIDLERTDGKGKARPAFLALQNLLAARKVSALIADADSEMLRCMRVAWSHGTWVAELELSTAKARLVGRKKMGEVWKPRIRDVVERLRGSASGSDRWPPAKGVLEELERRKYPSCIGLHRVEKYYAEIRREEREQRTPKSWYEQVQLAGIQKTATNTLAKHLKPGL